MFTGVTVTWVGAGVKQRGVTGEDWWNVDEVLLLGTEKFRRLAVARVNK